MIVTERLVLTPSAISDFDDCNAMRTDPAVMHFIGGVASGEDTWIRLLRNVGHWTAFGYGLFTIREKDGGRFVGEGGLAHFRRGLGSDFDDFPELYESLVIRRNAAWTQEIDRMLGDGRRYLVVVGALHLVGRDSVVERLAARGHRAVRLGVN